MPVRFKRPRCGGLRRVESGAAEAQGIDIKVLGATARKVYGDGMLKNLDDEQRAVVWGEVAR